MNNEKYYNPSIEEFHVGFKFEFETGIEGWKEFILKKDRVDATFRNLEYFKSQFRVKYLDKHDIEREGWEVSDSIHFQNERMLFNKGYELFEFKKDKLIYFVEKFNGEFGFDQNKIIISIWNTGTMDILKEDKPAHLFNGIIKNLSEFSRLQKQLGIK